MIEFWLEFFVWLILNNVSNEWKMIALFVSDRFVSLIFDVHCCSGFPFVAYSSCRICPEAINSYYYYYCQHWRYILNCTSKYIYFFPVRWLLLGVRPGFKFLFHQILVLVYFTSKPPLKKALVHEDWPMIWIK